MNLSVEEGGMPKFSETAQRWHDYEPFPALPPSVQGPLPDSYLEHRLALPQGCLPDVTRSTLIQGAWALIAGRMVNSEDAVFGIAVPGQLLPVAVPGDVAIPTMAMAPMCIKTASDQTISEYLLSVQRQALELANQVAWQQDAKCRSACQQVCAFQTLLVVQPSKYDSIHEAQITHHQESAHQLWQGTCALMVEARLSPHDILAKASFDSRVIAPWVVGKLLEQLDFVMQQLVVTNPGHSLEEIAMVTDQDLVKTWAWNSIVPLPVERCVHEIFEERVASQPGALAVCAWDGELTYGELDRLASQLAGKLVGLGVGDRPDMLVPLCFAKSVWTTVAVLGVLKAGGAFLLLDPSLPEKRLQFMVNHIKAKLLLSSASTQALSSSLVEEVVTIEPGFFTSLGEQPNQHLPRPSPSSLMYVTFTSGSTGAPKCVKTTHCNVASALYHQIGPMGLTKDSRVLDFSSYSFTTAISNVCGALAAGGCLCVPNDQDRRDKLPEVIRSFQASFIDLTPSVAQFLKPEEFPTLQTLILGGEVLRKRDVERWWGKIQTIHLYGQSECTSNGTINYNASSPESALRIGKGAGLITWVVDPADHNKLLPIGCTGELLFEGPLVGCGYLGDPEQTAAAFINDPSWLLRGAPGRPGRHGRLYKTGDLVQYTEDGDLTFIGRKDTQVKIRGQRVELGEVEHWVQKCMPDAVQAVAEVIQPQGESSSRALVAFIQLKDATQPVELEGAAAKVLSISADVGDKLAAHLPSYMVPTAFFSMGEIPMTATGKINRKRLREIGGLFSVDELAEMRTAGRGPKRQPTSMAEQSMQEIWAKVLNIGQAKIGLDDNFFHLGGDSIAAMKAVGEARRMGIGLAVADIFRHPTLHALFKHSLHTAKDFEGEIPPFALLGDGVDVASFLRNISAHYHLDPSKIRDAYPCTPLQEGLISLTSKRQGGYITQEVLKLSPNVAVKDLCTAWEQVARAMPILRTRIVQHNDLGLMQLVLDENIHWLDGTDLNKYIEADRKQPMGLGEPLTRYALIQDATGTTTSFVWTVHHALYDGWSISLIMDAVRQATRFAFIPQGPQPQLFIKYIKDQDHKEMVNYWVKSLAGYNTVPFPSLPPSVDQPSADKVVEHQIPQPAQRLHKDITISTLIRAAWALLASRMTNTDDAVFGATVSGRNAPVPGIDATVAPTFATIPLRVRTTPRQKVSEYLKAVQQQAVDMIPYEQAGLHRIAGMSPDSQRACMFQSLLVIQPQKTVAADEVLGSWQAISQQQWLNTYALMLEIRLEEDKLLASASFDSRVLEPWVVYTLLARLEFVIQRLDSASNERLLTEIDVMTAYDLEQIWEWNSTLPIAERRCAHDIIRERVLAQPAAPAICAWDGELSYNKLDQLALRLAGRLAELGVKHDTLVPLCFEKSMWVPVAMLGVLKAGGGFVLLDPSLPRHRLEAIVRQLNAAFILSSPANLHLSSQLSETVIQLDAESIILFEPAVTETALKVQPSSTAMFAVFTSGSTGTPKGVVLSHSNFCSGLKYQSHILGFTENSRVFDFASYAFDISVHNVFATLASGGCLCIPAEGDRRDNISKAMVEMGATVVNLTPSVARLIDPATVPQLDTLILAGEAVSIDDVMPWWGKTRVVNAYGPAECNISTINWEQSSPDKATYIGRGAGLVTWVVDPEDHNSLLPPGHIGELLLEGPLVGGGYLNDLQKTAEAFVEDPTWLTQGAPGKPGRQGRLYKTGDLVRYNQDGRLTFIGRKDAQVKVRGQRVELGEVEHWVQRCMVGAKQVIAEVVLLQGEHSSPTLMAFLQIENEATAANDPEAIAASILSTPTELEDHLAEYLPSYMIPAMLVSVRHMPMTPTGKTDRQRLREIGSSFSTKKLAQSQTAKLGSKREPETQEERQIQTIWAKVLGIEPCFIGANDSFIRLGGNSISAMRVVGEARKVGLQLAVADIFRRPRLHQLASHAIPSSGTAPNTIPNCQQRRCVEQSIAQERLWCSNQLYPGLRWHLMLCATRLRGPLQLSALKAALLALERSHETLRTTFGTQGGVHMQYIHPFRRKDLNVVDISSDRCEGLEHALQKDRMTPFNLAAEPGWRVSVYQLGKEEHVLSIVMHHIVSDGWSVDVLRTELAAFYSAAIRGHELPPQVDALPIQYRDYSTWQRQQEKMEVYQRQLEYWREQLETSRPAEFLCDKPRPSSLSGHTGAEEIKIEGRLYDHLQRFCKVREVTLFVMLLAAFRVTHCRLTGASDATIGTSNANRDRWEVRNMIGLLVNLQCIRIKVEGESFDELVRQVQATTVTSFVNQDVPFERIVSKLQADEDHSRHPLVQIIFAVHSQLDFGKFSFEGIEADPLTLPVTSRFDLEFHLYQEKNALRGSAIYSTDLYYPETIRNMLSVFYKVLKRGLADPTSTIRSLTLTD
ncbi:Nonribosomal peptide synthetase [Tolypocladium paradoxum]|uniref:Nonribosomal peptide synthetase n=1 Tax=Tolypocladium paradoxum TaxID=94208 RepID=A0A2S4L764_9HYPO|nr:Nonribosomal peptide synthetase [Tolypocladium paradoxum]